MTNAESRPGSYTPQTSKDDAIVQARIVEPRIYFDEVRLDTAGAETDGTPDVLRNAEGFPVRITHMLASLAYFDQAGLVENELEVQRVGVMLRFGDAHYMARVATALPIWSNEIVAAGAAVSPGTSSWRFTRPLKFAPQDALRVDAALEDAPASAIPAVVGVTGIGTRTKRPYFFSGELQLTAATVRTFAIDDFRNSSDEAVLLTDLTVSCSAPVLEVDPSGDIRRLRVSLRQLGNGTGRDWVAGQPPNTLAGFVPASLLGVTTGRAVVHRFPADGIVWDPGEGVSLIAQGLTASPPNAILHIGFVGHMLVT